MAASIMSYIQVNCEALRKLGKKIDKCLLLTGGALSLGEVTLQSNENGDNLSELTVEQVVYCPFLMINLLPLFPLPLLYLLFV